VAKRGEVQGNGVKGESIVTKGTLGDGLGKVGGKTKITGISNEHPQKEGAMGKEKIGRKSNSKKEDENCVAIRHRKFRQNSKEN